MTTFRHVNDEFMTSFRIRVVKIAIIFMTRQGLSKVRVYDKLRTTIYFQCRQELFILRYKEFYPKDNMLAIKGSCVVERSKALASQVCCGTEGREFESPHDQVSCKVY